MIGTAMVAPSGSSSRTTLIAGYVLRNGAPPQAQFLG